MKKRLLSLLVALCMAVTLLPVSAITAWAEEGGSNSTTLRIENGYPVGSGKTMMKIVLVMAGAMTVLRLKF